MNKDQITARIQEIENELSNLRAELNKPDKLTDFQIGDIITAEGGLSPVLITAANWTYDKDGYQKYMLAGLNGLITFSNHPDGATKEEILKHINGYKNPKIKGNINEEVADLIFAYAKK